jgi:muramoyltetrapeptide carboxypeptidase
MKRSQFIKSIVPIGVGAGLLSPWLAAGRGRHSDPVTQLAVRVPPALQRGDTIAITCPASAVEPQDLADCRRMLQQWGYRVRFGQTVGSHWQRFGGTDADRAADLQRLLDDPNTRAILFGRGGYGVMRMMDRLNWEKFQQQPKWLIGFSDLTALHCHVHTACATATLHADMGSGLGADYDTSARTLREALGGNRIRYQSGGHPLNRPGSATGQLVGGNLSMIYAMQGSKSALQTNGKILLIEDVSEYKYTVDRMMMNLKRSGKLDQLAALVVGGFTGTKADTDQAFTLSLEEIIMEKVQGFDFPVCFHYPSGHQKENWALKLGVFYELNVARHRVTLNEMAAPMPTGPQLGPNTKIDTLQQVLDSGLMLPQPLPANMPDTLGARLW